MKKTISKWLSILIPLALGIALIVYQYNSFTAQQLLEIKGYFKNANYFYIFLSLIIATFGFISRAYRWKFSIEQMGYQSKFQNNLMAVCACYFMNLSVPRSGEISRAIILKKYEDVPFDKAFGTIIAERVVDTILFFMFVIVAFILQFDILKNFILETIPFKKLLILLVVGVVFFIGFVLIWIYSNWSIINKLKQKLSGLIEGMTSILKMEKKWAFLFHSFFIWFSYLMMFYITIFALKETSNIGFNAVIIGFVFGTLAIGFTNSGFGAFPVLVAQIFMLYGISNTAGTAFGWLVWTSQTSLTIVLGGLSFLYLPIFNRK
ncbi:YbhN family protein [Flavobacterium sp.]|uniref:lysylphosphatidylglycerol synthase transmembrane domain-containing protein n=1 Tax=Flavobacterium sp. TaxID=239 RepID=UPI00375186D5